MLMIGTCVDSFNDDGDCIQSSLPWSTVSDFACAVEQYGNQFTIDNVVVTYDDETDIHTFWLTS